MVLTKSLIPFHTVTSRADTVLIVASGPSLRGFDLARLHGKGYIIAVNNAVRFVKADAWITVDTLSIAARLNAVERFTDVRVRYAAVPEEFGRTDARCPCDRVMPRQQCNYLHRTQAFSEKPDAICGDNSALGALNLAYHLKAERIVLFGVDGNSLEYYFYGKRQAFKSQNLKLLRLPEMFAAAAPHFTECKVVNASADSAVTCFERASPEEALRRL